MNQRRSHIAPHIRVLVILTVLFLILLGASACATGEQSQVSLAEAGASPTNLTLTRTNTAVPPTATATATKLEPTAMPSVTPTFTPEPTPTSTARAFLVAVDPGHGGVDLGARRFDDQGHMVYHESTVNLELGLLLRDELLKRGFQVVMTRDTDSAVNEDEIDVTGDGEFEYTLDETQARVDLINASGADMLLSLHQNAYESASGEGDSEVGGIQTYYCADREFAHDNYRFAQLVHEYLIQAIHEYGYDIQDRGILDDAVLVTPDSPGRHLIMLGPESVRIVRPSQMPGALSEPLFITHVEEGLLAREPEFLAALAVAYADAIEAYVDGDETGQDSP